MVQYAYIKTPAMQTYMLVLNRKVIRCELEVVTIGRM